LTLTLYNLFETYFQLIVEPSAAICLAAVLKNEDFRRLPKIFENIGIVLCGGNVDVDNLPWKSSLH